MLLFTLFNDKKQFVIKTPAALIWIWQKEMLSITIKIKKERLYRFETQNVWHWHNPTAFYFYFRCCVYSKPHFPISFLWLPSLIRCLWSVRDACAYTCAGSTYMYIYVYVLLPDVCLPCLAVCLSFFSSRHPTSHTIQLFFLKFLSLSNRALSLLPFIF